MAPRPFNVRFGNLKKEGMTAVVFSRSNVAVSLTINGQTYSISLTVTGNDRGSADDAGVTYAGYRGTQVISGITAFQAYAWSATQSGITYSGTQYPAPQHKGQDFAVGYGTCFGPSATDDEQDTAWTFLNWYRQHGSLPYINTFFIDDIYYADGNFSYTYPTWVDPHGKTMETTVVQYRSQYDFSLLYGCWFGIFGPFYDPTDTALEFPMCHAAHHIDFMELLDNSAFMPSVGDHEFINNIWDANLATVPNQVHATAGAYDGNGYVVWTQLMQPLSGTTAAVTADAHALHWYCDLGSMRHIASDPSTQVTFGVDMYGAGQLADLRLVADGTQWFTSLGMPLGCREPPLNYYPTGFGYKSENFVVADYNNLMRTTGLTPKSLMDNNRTNGNLGATWIVRGDNHQGDCFYFMDAAGGGLAAESFNELCLNTMNDNVSSGTQYHPDYINWEAADGMRLVGGSAALYNAANPAVPLRKPARMTATIAEVWGSKPTPEVILRQYEIVRLVNDTGGYGDMAAYFHPELCRGDVTDHRGNVWRCVFEKRIVLYAGNEGFDLDEEPYQLTTTNINGGDL